MENSKFEAFKNKNKEANSEEKEEKNPFGLSEKELDDLYSGNDNSEMYEK